MLLALGTKLLVCHRRLFADDHPRFFAGVVEAYESGIAKITGFTWSRDPARGFQRRAEARTKLVAIASGTLMVYELPAEVNLEKLRIEQPNVHAVLLTDGVSFQMDLAERL